MRNLTFGNSRCRKFDLFGWSIRKITGKNYSHCYFKFHAQNIDRFLVYEAHREGLTFSNFARWSKRNLVVQEVMLTVTDETYTRVMQYCVDHEGIPYPIKGVFGTLLKKVFKLKKNPFADGYETVECAEIIALILRDVLGEKIEFEIDSAEPSQVWDKLSEMAGRQSVFLFKDAASES